jgi:hypothetical protein
MLTQEKTEQQKTDRILAQCFDDNFEQASDLLQKMLVKLIMRTGRNPEMFKNIAVNEWERLSNITPKEEQDKRNNLQQQIETLQFENRMLKGRQELYATIHNDLVWMTREEFNHCTAIQKMKTVNIDFIREFALSEMQRSKAAMNSSFDIGDDDEGHFFKVDALEWALLARGLQREINKLGGL